MQELQFELCEILDLVDDSHFGRQPFHLINIVLAPPARGPWACPLGGLASRSRSGDDIGCPLTLVFLLLLLLK